MDSILNLTSEFTPLRHVACKFLSVKYWKRQIGHKDKCEGILHWTKYESGYCKGQESYDNIFGVVAAQTWYFHHHISPVYLCGCVDVNVHLCLRACLCVCVCACVCAWGGNIKVESPQSQAQHTDFAASCFLPLVPLGFQW